MYIILFSIVISAVILGAYQYIDSINRDSNAEPYDVTKDLFTVNNIMAYVLIASGVFFVMYMAFNDDLDIFSSLGIMEKDNGYEIKKMNVNTSVLRNTTDPMKMGFEPYNSDGGGSGGSNAGSNAVSDASSVSSSECSADSE
jgi:hypothetical protein